MGRRRSRRLPGSTYVFGDTAAKHRSSGCDLFDLLLGIYATKKIMTAKDFCKICPFLTDLETPGAEWRDWGGSSGHHDDSFYKRHLDTKLPGSGPYYKALIPWGLQDAPVVKSKEVCFNMVWEHIAQEVRESHVIQELMRTGDENNFDSPMSLPVYTQNELTLKAKEETGMWPVPLALYLDGVRYTPLCAGRSSPVKTCVSHSPPSKFFYIQTYTCLNLVGHKQISCD